MNQVATHCFEFGPFRLDADKRLLLRDGEVIPLTPKCIDLLLVFVETGGEVLSKDDLLNRVWPGSFVEEGNLTYNISMLRKALGEKASTNQYIVTISGHGYRFVADVLRVGGEPLGSSLEQSVKPSPVRTPASSKSRWAIVASILIVFCAVMIYWLLARPTPIKSIAVLPFENGSGDANLDYLSDGLSESVIDRLSQLPQLKVIARRSSFKYRGQNLDLKEIANALGVKAIITGRVVQRGDSLIVRVEIIDTGENRQLWSEQFTRKATDAIAVQQEVAQSVSKQLHLKLSGTQAEKLTKQDKVDWQAYELLLKGRIYQINRGTESSKKAIEFYRQAIAIDPNYALAYAFLSDCYWWLIGPGVLDPKEFTPKAQAAAQKALELDPNLAEGHLAMANLHMNDWKWAAAETEYKRAIESNPNFVMARSNYSAYLSIIGRHDEAIAEAQRTKELDPLTLQTHVTVAYTLAQARRYDEAIAEFKNILDVDKNYVAAYVWLAWAYSGKGMYQEALDIHQEINRLGDNNSSQQIYLGAAYALAGKREKALDILKQLETSKEYVSPGELPVLLVALGEHEKAFASFEKAYAAHDLQLQYLKVDPSFDPLREDPRFADLLRRVGLQ